MTRGRTRENPRGLRLVATLSVVGGCAGALYSLQSHESAAIGALVGACDGALLSFLEIFVLRRWAHETLLRWPLAAYFALRVALYAAVVVAVNGAADSLAGASVEIAAMRRRDLAFGFAMCVAINLLFSVNALLGPGVFFAFAAGRYRRPRKEERTLLCLDLVGSTALAEALGEERFLDLLNAFFADVTTEIVAEGGEIHKYVGDEIIATWRAGVDPAKPIRACFAASRRLFTRAANYRAEFGAAPEFRAAIHAGTVVIGELGLAKKEIALIGDAMNTAARILEAARETGAHVLISAALFERMRAPPEGISVRRLAPIALRGKMVPLALVSLDEERQRLAGGGAAL